MAGGVRERLKKCAFGFRLAIVLRNASPIPEDAPVITTVSKEFMQSGTDCAVNIIALKIRMEPGRNTAVWSSTAAARRSLS
jgi:hypothetical protein